MLNFEKQIRKNRISQRIRKIAPTNCELRSVITCILADFFHSGTALTQGVACANLNLANCEMFRVCVLHADVDELGWRLAADDVGAAACAALAVEGASILFSRDHGVAQLIVAAIIIAVIINTLAIGNTCAFGHRDVKRRI